MPSSAELLRFLPEMILTVVATLIMCGEVLTSKENKGVLSGLGLVGLAAALYASILAGGSPGMAFNNMLIVDGFGTFFRVLVCVVGLLTILSSTDYLKKAGHDGGEYYALLLYSVVGQMIMATANELIMVFIGLEISSIATYIMAGYLRDDKRNNESAIKYFLLGSFATAFLLYGVAWIYGLTGSTNLAEIRRILSTPDVAPDASLVGLASALIFVGFAFKVSAAPFQVWAPDVYQGAPAPVAAFLSAGPKAAAFAVFLRVYMTAFLPTATRWEPLVVVTAILTMVVGNFAALMQKNVKRLLAYSSIAHAGYVLIAIGAQSETGTAAMMFYLASYAFMNIGAFAVVTWLARKDEKYVNVDDLAGLATRQPFIAAMLAIFMLSLIGVPLTGGFFGKFYIFKAALDSNLVWLTVIGLLNSAVAAYYYLRILVVMYMREPGEAVANLDPVPAGLKIAIVGSAVATVVLGVFPGVILDFATKSAVLGR